jgi:hypothetical protein
MEEKKHCKVASMKHSVVHLAWHLISEDGEELQGAYNHFIIISIQEFIFSRFRY